MSPGSEPGSEQTSTAHPALVDDQEIPRSEEVRKVEKPVVGQVPGVEESGVVTGFDGSLGNGRLGKVVPELARLQSRVP